MASFPPSSLPSLLARVRRRAGPLSRLQKGRKKEKRERDSGLQVQLVKLPLTQTGHETQAPAWKTGKKWPAWPRILKKGPGTLLSI